MCELQQAVDRCICMCVVVCTGIHAYILHVKLKNLMSQ